MKKTYSLVIAFLLISCVTLAQANFRLNEDTVVYEVANDIDWKSPTVELPINAAITTDSDDLQLSWEVLENNHPDAWTSAVCDNFNCYESPEVGFTKASAPISKDSEGFIRAIMYAKKLSGNAKVVLKVFETNNPTSADTLVLVWSISLDPTSIEKHKPNYNFTLFPNPCQSELRVTFPDLVDSNVKIKIYNLVGQEQRNIHISKEDRALSVDLRKLNNGTYLIQFVSPNGQLNTQRFTKKA